MKRIAVALAVGIGSSLMYAPQAKSAGFILVDPAFGGAAAVVPTVTPRLHPGVVTPIPPGHRLPSPHHPTILHGGVSFGLHLQSEDVHVEIKDQVAKTYITQTFVNDTDRNLAGTYMFPLPEDTTFSSFSLHIDGKPVEGKILEANEARQQYEAIVRQMVDPGLLEYADYKTVRARIFPIPAHGTKKVEFEYTQVLKADNGLLKYNFPLASKAEQAPVEEVKIDVKLASNQGLRTIWSPSHTVTSIRSDDQHAKIALVDRNVIPTKDFLLYYSVSNKDMAANLLTHKAAAEDGYFMMTLSPPLKSNTVVGKDIILVVDTSGSMMGQKLEQAKKALNYVVHALNNDDRFNIINFNTDVDSFKSSLITASAENKKAAESFINDLEARGGTNISDALAMGCSLFNEKVERPAYIVLMTDGEPTVGKTDTQEIVKSIHCKRDVRVFDFGVGYDVNTRLLNKLASEHHGTSQYVEPNENLEESLSSFYQKIKSPVLNNVKIAYDGVVVKDVYPREVKDVFAGTQVLLIGKYKNSGRANVTVTGQVNGQNKVYSFPLSFAEEPGHSYLPRLWAMRRIGHLTEVAQENGNNREVVDEIVALSKRYGIISQYTSFLVTEPNSGDGRFPVAFPRPTARPLPVAEQRLVPSIARHGAAMGKAASPAAADSSSINGTLIGSRFRFAPSSYRGAQQMQLTSEAQSFDNKREIAYTPYPAADAYKAGFAGGSTGRDAVRRSKAMNSLKTIATEEKEQNTDTVRTVEDKTFYLQGDTWVDSAALERNAPQPEVVHFGSDRYFELLRTTPGLSKFLSLGKQVHVVFKGHAYKIVLPTGS